MDYPTDIKGEMPTTMPYACMVDDSHEIKVCVVCGERASGFYFGALVCLPCKVGAETSCDGFVTGCLLTLNPYCTKNSQL